MRFLRLGPAFSTCFTEFSTCFTVYGPPYWANRPRDNGQNSVKYRPTLRYTVPALQFNTELHQKDLRINLEMVHIWDPENEAYLRADTNLALSLIVGF